MGYQSSGCSNHGEIVEAPADTSSGRAEGASRVVRDRCPAPLTTEVRSVRFTRLGETTLTRPGPASTLPLNACAASSRRASDRYADVRRRERARDLVGSIVACRESAVAIPSQHSASCRGAWIKFSNYL